MAIGTTGYILLEDARPLDALYMTAITVSTVGYNETVPATHPLTTWFTMGLIFFGIGFFFWVVVEMAQFTVSEQIQRNIGRRSVRWRLENLDEHFILCGYGRMGRRIAEFLDEQGVSYVVIDSREMHRDMLQERDVPFIIDDASGETVLEQARIDKARGLIACTGSDPVNVYITLTARALQPELFIVARADDEEAAPKLHRAGADRVIAPYTISAERVANTLLRPAVVNFMELAIGTGERDLQIEQLEVQEGTPYVGKTLAESNFRNEYGVIVVAIQTDEGIEFNPDASTPIGAGDVLVVLGHKDALAALAGSVGRGIEPGD